MACRRSVLFAARVARGPLAASTQASTAPVAAGRLRGFSSILLTGHIDAADVLKANATSSDEAFRKVALAERKVQHEYNDINRQPQFQDLLTRFTWAEACALVRIGLDSPSSSVQWAALRSCHQLLVQEVEQVSAAQMIDGIIRAGILPNLVRALGDSKTADVQLEAITMLNAIAAGSPVQTQAVISSGAVPELSRLAESGHQSLREQAARALRHINRAAGGLAHGP